MIVNFDITNWPRSNYAFNSDKFSLLVHDFKFGNETGITNYDINSLLMEKTLHCKKLYLMSNGIEQISCFPAKMNKKVQQVCANVKSREL